MLRLRANKTSLHRLVWQHDAAVGGFRHCEFIKVPRQPSYFLNWSGGGLWCKAYFTACCGKAMLTIEKKDFCGKQISREVYTLDIDDLRERGMIEEVKG